MGNIQHIIFILGGRAGNWGPGYPIKMGLPACIGRQNCVPPVTGMPVTRILAAKSPGIAMKGDYANPESDSAWRGSLGWKLVVCILFGTFIARSAYSAPLSVEQVTQLALRCGPTVAPSTLVSIAEVESGLQPLAIKDNSTGAAGIPPNREVAVQIASRLLKAGHRLDLGLMQINSANLSKLGIVPDEAFNPCKSIAVAAGILSNDYEGGETYEAQQAALRNAISSYNTGSPERGFENGYVHKVELAARQIVPALDTEPLGPSAGPDPQNSAATDKAAPPSWDVWGTYEYEESLSRAVQGRADAPAESVMNFNESNMVGK
jgi:type IV secretion system protein VirB1